MTLQANKVKADLIRDSGVIVDAGMITIRRAYAIYNMPQTTNLLTDALTVAGIPQHGDPHPVYPKAYAKTFQVLPLIEGKSESRTAVEVIVTYINRPIVIQFGSALRQIETDTDRTGKMIYASWSGARDPDTFTNNAQRVKGQLTKQRAIAPKLVRDDIITFSSWFLVKNAGDYTYPTPIETLKEKYMGKVNSKTFRGKDKRVWMCIDVSATTDDFGKSYHFDVKLQARNGLGRKDNQDGWSEWVYYRMANGEVPKNAFKDFDNEQNSDGVRKIDNIYEEIDFLDIQTDIDALIK